jgi:predicted dehydrogenase
MNIGIIGLGYWGPNLVRNFIAQKSVEKVIAFDQRAERLDFIKTKSPSVLVSESYEVMLKSEIDALVIATPVESHFNLAKRALEAGKHIWVEKPFTSTSQQGEELLEIADKKNLRILLITLSFIQGCPQDERNRCERRTGQNTSL